MIGSTVSISVPCIGEGRFQISVGLNPGPLEEFTQDWAGGWRVRRGVFVRGVHAGAAQP
jgi:hypothetical protein